MRRRTMGCASQHRLRPRQSLRVDLARRVEAPALLRKPALAPVRMSFSLFEELVLGGFRLAFAIGKQPR